MKSYKWNLDATKVKEWISPYDFYLQEQDLGRFGYRSGQWVVAGLCPFDDDGSAGSFRVNCERGAVHGKGWRHHHLHAKEVRSLIS